VKVPFVDLKMQHQSICEELASAIQNVIHDTAFIRGKYVKEFATNFSKFCEAKYCIGVGNGTDALFVALKSLKIGEGDEVVVPANTFIATSEAVSMTGAKVVFADCDPNNYCMDLNFLQQAITPKTKAVIPVHLYGCPADMTKIRNIADKHDLKIVQDCAQAHGAEISGKALSKFGDILCFSFYPGKNLGAYGDAGAIVLNDADLAERIEMFANHGRKDKYNHEYEGINSRMDGIQGAVLNVKLRRLEEWTEKRRKNASHYDNLLRNIPGIHVPKSDDSIKHVYHLYVIRSKKRDELRHHLGNKGISTGIHYPVALPNLNAYRYLGYKPEDFPVASMYQDEILSLPMFPELTEEMIEYVACQIQVWSDKKRN
jgi:dTDP-4-amino-4,6-dideoxygalactose transaminase